MSLNSPQTPKERLDRLYFDLVHLADRHSRFEAKIEALGNGRTFVTFHYHQFAGFSDFFQNPYASPSVTLEARGICWDITNIAKNGPVIASRPMQKFFSHGENPIVEKMDPDELVEVYVKHDGSLISSGLWREGENQGIFLKSRKSIRSPHAELATKYTEEEKFRLLGNFIKVVTAFPKYGATVNLEMMSPTDDTAIIPCETPQLIILNIRDNETGAYYSYWDRVFPFGKEVLTRIEELYRAKPLPLLGVIKEKFLASIPKDTHKEGYVCHFKNSKTGSIALVKYKTDWYNNLRKLPLKGLPSKDAVFNICLSGGIDDLVSRYKEHPEIKAMCLEINEALVKFLGNIDEEYFTFKERVQELGNDFKGIVSLLREHKASEYTFAKSMMLARGADEMTLSQYSLEIAKKRSKEICKDVKSPSLPEE